VLAATLFSILLALCAGAPALDPSLDASQYAHSAWKIREGFAKGRITSIVQGPDGYLWLGTESGLYRFDGVRNVLWEPPPGEPLPGSMILSLLAARDGTLWIGTDKGLASWKDGKLTYYRELAGIFIFTIVEDRDGEVWAGGYGIPNGKLCAIQNDSTHCYGEDGRLGPGVSGLYEDSKGNLWVGVVNGLWRWKPGTSDFYPVPDAADSIRAFVGGDDGALLFTTRTGIDRLINGKIEPYSLPGNLRQLRIQRMLRDGDGALWLGTADHGVVHVHHGRMDVFARSESLSGDWVTTLFEDREGDIWIATTGGLDRFRELAVAAVSVDQGLTSASVLSVFAGRDGSIWLGTAGGLDRWNDGRITIPPTGSAKRDGKLNGEMPNSLFQDSRRRIWVSTQHGFGYLEKDKFISINGVPGGPVHGIAEENDGNLWIANQESGLIRLSARGEIQEIPWAGLGHKDHANALIADPVHGGLWLGFFQGGIAYFNDGGIRASYGAGDGLGEGMVTSFRFDPDGTLWIATQGGLSRLKNGRFATLTSKNGLPCDPVHWTMEDEGHSFWLQMGCGLVHVTRSDIDSWVGAVENDRDANRETRAAIRATVFDSSDGVTTRALASGYRPLVAKSSDGRLWFTGYEGASVLDPRHIPFNRLLPPVHIEQIAANHKSYPVTSDANGNVRLPPLIRDLQIDYTALSFVAPEKVLFRYKLEGRDRDWQDAGTRRQAFYNNLPPRNYRFRVMACNNSGVWNEAGTFLDFSIAQAYYQTWWFRSLCGVAFLAIVYGAYRLRVGQLRAQEERFRETIESIPAMAFVSLPDGYRTFVNKGWAEYTGITLEQSLGSGWHAAIHPEDLKRVLGEWEAALASGRPMYYEARYRRAEDGQYRWFMVRVVPQRNKRGEIAKWFGTLADIEDRKRAEQEREKLRQLEAELAHINRVSMLGEMAASLAHEIKQPIAAAINSANSCIEWLAHEPPNLDRARASATRIDKYGNRAAEIIDRIRSLYRKTPSRRELVDVNGIIEEILALLKCEADRYSIAMRTELAAELPKIIVDRVQLQQVFMNLLLNAIEAMKDSGGELTAKSELQDGQLQFSVSDTGVGVPKEKMDQIFSAFFTTKPQGSGMGLSISRSIVESHGGRLWATANNGRGATFHFTLPLAIEAVQVPGTGTGFRASSEEKSDSQSQ
jgi:PAS domain S-box-containing protein